MIVCQPRSGETNLALDECGKSSKPSVTQGILSEGYGGEGIRNDFECLSSNRNISAACNVSLCMTRCVANKSRQCRNWIIQY